MRNKMLGIVGAVILLFVALFFVVDYKNKQTIDISGNPYGKDNLKQETIDQLNDSNYQNQITPDRLAERLANQEDVTVYFYSPTCIYCQNTTPELVKVAEDLDIDVVKLNLLEFEAEWDTYGIEGTPTIIHFENGEEVTRISGQQDEDGLRHFFSQFDA